VTDIWGDVPEGATTEEVILSKQDTALGYLVSVKLITYPDGTMDLFRHQGNEFNEHISEAKAVLEARGLVVGDVEVAFQTGAYLPVRQKIDDFPDALAPVRENPLTLAMTPFLGHATMVDFAFADKLSPMARQERPAVKNR
jgi:hypothetical protein